VGAVNLARQVAGQCAIALTYMVSFADAGYLFSIGAAISRADGSKVTPLSSSVCIAFVFHCRRLGPLVLSGVQSVFAQARRNCRIVFLLTPDSRGPARVLDCVIVFSWASLLLGRVNGSAGTDVG